MLYFRPAPGATGSGASVIAPTKRSKPEPPSDDVTVDVFGRWAAVSFSHVVGSVQSPTAGSAVAVFEIVPVARSLTLTRIVIIADWPTSRPPPPSLQVTVPAAWEH